MKNHSHIFRMNPQTARRRSSSVSVPAVIGFLMLAAFGALYCIGKLHTK